MASMGLPLPVMGFRERRAHLGADRVTSITGERPDRERRETGKTETDKPKLLDFQRKKVEALAPHFSQISPLS